MSVVVKLGGSTVADEAWLCELGRAIAGSERPVVVVHGGGPEVSELSAALGVATKFVEGRRVTPPAALDVAAMVLTGRVNKRIVRALRSAGVDAFGVSGEDGGLVSARVAAGGALGRVGEVAGVRGELLEWLLARGLVPVISPISASSGGEALNVNADEVAAAVAVAIGADELLFLTGVEGVLTEAGRAAQLTLEESVQLMESGVVRDGMRVKVEASLRALEQGVASVRIGGPAMLSEAAAGTRVGALGVAA